MGEFHRRMTFTVGSVIQHFKRETADLDRFPLAYLYRIIAFATHTETGEPLVVYESLGENEIRGIKVPKGHIYARPSPMLYSKVDKEKYPNIKQQFRFIKVDEPIRTSDISDYYMNLEKQFKEATECKN